MRELAELARNVTSPAKIAFVGYVILVFKYPEMRPPWWLFLVIAFGFVLVQAAHDDWLRIWLNRLGETTRLPRWLLAPDEVLALRARLAEVLPHMQALEARVAELERRWTADVRIRVDPRLAGRQAE